MVSNILKALEEKANKQLNLILEEKDKGLLSLKEDFQQRAQEKQQKEQQELERALQKDLASLSQQLFFNHNLEIQSQKAKGLNEVYQIAREKLNGISEIEMEKFFKKILNVLPKKEGVITAGKNTFSFLKKLPQSEKMKIEEGLKEEGFIFKSEGFEIDFRFQELLKEFKETIEPELAKIIYA